MALQDYKVYLIRLPRNDCDSCGPLDDLKLRLFESFERVVNIYAG